ncbi:hypothetical protein cypCar_00030072 [Cyprinus carpio]|nr:hypothetical protein cypCar_00030072 [Cyprinus carpio]
MSHNSIHWFRKGLRLHDNPALIAALKDCRHVYPLFLLDPWYSNNSCIGINRWRFLIEALRDLDASLKKLNSRLFVVSGPPTEVLPKLFEKWKITRLTFEVDTEPYSQSRDKEVMKLAKEYGVEVIPKISHTLYNIDRIIDENNGKPPMTYVRFQSVVKDIGPPKKPVPAPTKEDMKENTFVFLQAWVCKFEKPKTSPNSIIPSTTVLSPYVRFGCLSARTFWWRLAEVYRGKQHSEPPVSLHGQLLWREFFYTTAVGIPNFNRMEGNPHCVQVDWDKNPEHLAAWREVFEELLLDADWSLNAGNWQWLSASAFFHQYFRVYSPIAFGKKTDKYGDYIKKYLPVLNKFPAEYIYEPWKAPRSVQERAGCIVGKDYPRPLVEHDVIHKKNIQRMKAAYAKRSSEDKDDQTITKGAKRKATSIQDMFEKKAKR